MAYDPAVVEAIKRIGRKRGMDEEAVLGAIATGIVESGLQQLSGGDRDSYGWRQQRESIYGRQGLNKSINNFFDEWKQFDKPGFNPGLTAANVQRPAEQYRGRYADVLDEARKVLGGDYKSGTSVGSSPESSGSPASGGGANPFGAIAALNPNQSPIIQQGWDLLGQAWAQQNQGQSNPMIAGVGGGGGGKGSPAGKGSGLAEFFYDPIGGWKNGQQIGAIGGHDKHLHVGGNPKTIAEIVAEAQRRGRSVREYAPVDPVDPVHTENSYHYRNGGRGAADIEPGPGLIKWIRKRYGLK